MRILTMTATFGKLDNETLRFTDGLNVFSAPNEWGKSTWCAFLCAMLYGIDTRERSGRETLAEKEKYAPWSGKPMEGALRILHEGRDITIERRTKGRVPLGEFRAFESKTGLSVPELTPDNCGQVLLGVEKSVFLRTGFLRFADLPVKQDENLRKRLNALVTTGDESGSAELLGSRLKELKNRCRYNNTGRIPACQEQIRQLQEQLWERQNLQHQLDALTEQLIEEEARREALENHRIHLQWLEAQEDKKRIAEARTAAKTAEQLAQTMEKQFRDVPDREKVEAKIRQGKDLLEELELNMDTPPGSPTPMVIAVVLAVVLLFAALVGADRNLLWPCLLMAAAALSVAGILAGRRRRERVRFNVEQARARGKREELVRFVESWTSTLRAMDQLDTARENARKAQLHLHDLEAMARYAEGPEPEDSLTLTKEETLRAIAEQSTAIDRSRLQLAQYRGRMERTSEETALQTRLSQERHRLAELEKTFQALSYAQNALDTAMQELQRRFAPRITRRAGEHLRFLTGGAYDRITIGEDLSIQAARGEESTLRSAQWRSEGTADQMYLALRLAVWEVLCPQSPLILDDALIRFDQSRMERAMELLQRLARDRQILLFSCQNREREWQSQQS